MKLYYILYCYTILLYHIVFDWLYFIQCCTSFSSISHVLCLYAVFDAILCKIGKVLLINSSANVFVRTVFDAILSKIGKVLLINSSANVFLFGDFNVHDKDWLTYSGRIDRHGEL